MNNPKKLNIRIKFAPQKPEVIPEETGYIYHWKRIVGVSLLAVTTLAVSSYGVFNSLDQANAAVQSAEIKIKTTNPASVKESAIQAQPDSEPVTSTSNQKNSTSLTAEKTNAKQIQPDSDPLISSSNQENSTSLTAEKTSAKKIQPDSDPLISSSNQKNSTSLTAEKTSAKKIQPDGEPVTSHDNSNQKSSISLTTEKTVQTDNASAPLLTQSDSEIFSEQIKPFVIAKTVKDKEPIGTINDIKLDANNIVTVYAYSKVVGLKGETLYYKWRLNGKDIAQVKVRVRSDRWRSYSRKFIQPHMQGDWSVALENSKGELLALNRFQY